MSPAKKSASSTREASDQATPEAQPPASYEEARDELASVVTSLERGGLSLEESMRLWERGEELSRQCEALLVGARRRLDAAVERSHEGRERQGASSDEASGATEPGGRS